MRSYLAETLLIRTTSRINATPPIIVQIHIPPPIQPLPPIHPFPWFIVVVFYSVAL